jgi:hypothetical protein
VAVSAHMSGKCDISCDGSCAEERRQSRRSSKRCQPHEQVSSKNKGGSWVDIAPCDVRWRF